MGKKVKNNGRSPRKLSSQVPGGSPRAVSKQADMMTEGGAEGVDDRELCKHYRKGDAKLNRILLRIHSSSDVVGKCDDCREDLPGNKRGGGKGKGKNVRKKAVTGPVEANSGLDLVWVCLDCNHFACGGGVSDLEPHGHARRHAKQERHSLAVQLDNPLVCWCFSCNSSVPIEMPEPGNGELKQATDVEDVWFGGDGENERKMENEGEPLVLEIRRGYAVRGLMNLGNTCFFNSVMQNLLSMDMLRDYFMSLDQPTGPVTMALKKLFVETGAGSGMDYKCGINPKNLFGCICSKAPQFRGYQQQDSHELLRYLLDGLSTEESSVRKSNVSSDEGKTASNSVATFVDFIFGGQLSSTVCCMECGHTSKVYEPFLDLSLPVPTKKAPPKKVPVTPTKRSKLPLREGHRGRGRRLRERGSTKVIPVLDQCKTETASFPLEPGVTHCNSPPEQEQAVALAGGDFFSWVDSIGSGPLSDDINPISQSSDTHLIQDVEIGPSESSGENLQSRSDMQSDFFSKELIVPLECSGENCCRDEVPSQVQDSEVLLLPYEKLDSTAEEMIGPTVESQNLADTAVGDTPVKELNGGTSSSIGCELAEPDFDGFGDLFNEPETTSDMKMETSICEDMETSWLGGNSSESNQDEVDGTNAPVSVDSCLACFTKPELLFDEHAWHCENCSKILQRQNVENRKGKRPAVAGDNQLEASTSQASSDKVICKNAVSNLDEDTVDSTAFKILDNGKLTTTSEDLVSNADKLSDVNPDANIDNKPLYAKSLELVGSDCTECDSWQSGNGKSLRLVDSRVTNQDNCLEVSKDEYFDESDHTCQFLSCNSTLGKHISQASSSNQDDNSCSRNELNDVVSDIRALEAGPRSSLDHRETIPTSSHVNDNCREVEHVVQKGSKLLSRMRAMDDSEEEPASRKVKRDATKRILIDKAPPILTIHLKRFSQDVRGRLNKLSGHVNFHETLDLKPYMDTRCRERAKVSYRLVGVVEHSGNMRGGHYAAYVRGKKNRGKTEKDGPNSAWFYASDAHVREVSLSEVLKSEAYILFYERV